MKKLIKRIINKIGYDFMKIEKHKESNFPIYPYPYLENPEVGAVNLEEKIKRVKEGGPFEWPNMVALNRAVVTLVGPALRIVELGGGTGCFAYEAAADPKRFIVCSDLDKEAINWAKENRSRPNIHYIDRLISAKDGIFDLVVAMDVIEHIEDYRSFLETCAVLAPRAIITTPNKNRDPQSAIASPPKYKQHVREWTAGEFYWILKMIYKDVKLYAMPNVYIPEIVPIQIIDSMSPLIALCEHPYNLSSRFDSISEES